MVVATSATFATRSTSLVRGGDGENRTTRCSDRRVGETKPVRRSTPDDMAQIVLKRVRARTASLFSVVDGIGGMASESWRRNESLYDGLSECRQILERLRSNQQHHQNGRPLPQRVEEALTRLENVFRFCLPVCAGQSSKMYPCMYEVLTAVSLSSQHSLLKLYFSRTPLWRQYQQNVSDIMQYLSDWCERRRLAVAAVSPADDQLHSPPTNVPQSQSVGSVRQRLTPSRMVLKLKNIVLR